jgi:hypothetical protein
MSDWSRRPDITRCTLDVPLALTLRTLPWRNGARHNCDEERHYHTHPPSPVVWFMGMLHTPCASWDWLTLWASGWSVP